MSRILPPSSGPACAVPDLRLLHVPRRVFCLLGLAAALTGCSNSEGPEDNSLPDYVSAYHYTNTIENRYFEITPVPDTCGGCADTLVDSIWRVYSQDGIYWSQSYRAVRHFRFDSASGQWLVLGDENATGRREGRQADTLVLDPSLLYKLLVAPVQAGTTWFVDDSATIPATIVAEQTILLGTGNTRTWHVQRGAMGDEWWAPGLGRVQYEELAAGGQRRRGRLVGVGVFP